MLAKLAESLPDDGTFLFEPKWDGFRAIVFRGAADVYIQSRDLKPLDRYFPVLHDSLLERLPKGSVIDGEIGIARRGRGGRMPQSSGGSPYRASQRAGRRAAATIEARRMRARGPRASRSRGA